MNIFEHAPVLLGKDQIWYCSERKMFNLVVFKIYVLKFFKAEWKTSSSQFRPDPRITCIHMSFVLTENRRV